MNRIIFVFILPATYLLAAVAAPSIDQKTLTTSNPPLTPRDEMIQTQESLADLHQKEATCLKSKKTIDECRNEMMKSCPVSEMDECKPIDTAELQKHQNTPEQAGILAKKPSPPPGITTDSQIK